MRRFCLFILLIISMGASAQIAEAWVSMPDTLCPYLSKQQRYYMAQYATAGTKDSVNNAMDGKSVIDSISSEYLSAQIAANLHWTLSIVGAPEGSNLPDGRYLCLQSTVCAPLCATTYLYFDFVWNQLFSKRDPLVIEQEGEEQLF